MYNLEKGPNQTKYAYLVFVSTAIDMRKGLLKFCLILTFANLTLGIICKFKVQSVRQEDFIIQESLSNIKSHLICSLKADFNHYPAYKQVTQVS